MDVIRTIKPGQKGSLRLVKQYGERLVAVRYRKNGRQRITTVELIVEERIAKISYDEIAALVQQQPNKSAALRIDYTEKDLQAKIKQAGGWWNAKDKVWELLYQNVVALGLTDRIVSLADKK